MYSFHFWNIIQSQLSITRHIRKTAAAAAAKSLQSCPTLCDPIDGNPPGSPVPGILQARTLEWVAIVLSISKSEQIKTQELLFKKPKYVSKFYCEK